MSPRFSVLTAVYGPEPEHLAECLASVAAQTEASWEHVLVDDASPDTATATALRTAAGDEARRRVITRPRNGGIAAASNDALAAATGEWIVLLDHDDVLDSGALHAMAAAIDAAEAAGRAVDVLYSDHDLLRPDGRCASPMYKPEFSLTRLRNHNYITHLVVIRHSVLDRVGGWREGFDGAQDHDLLLRLAEVTDAFVRVPGVLLHWRQAPASVALQPESKPAAYERARQAVAEHLGRCGVEAEVRLGSHLGVVRIDRTVPAGTTVSVVVPTRGSRSIIWGAERICVHDAVASIVDAQTVCDIEVVTVVDEGTDPVVVRGLRQIAGDRLVVVEYGRPFNFADKINLGVAASRGELVLLLNDDTELIAPDGVDVMAGLALEAAIGMVGAKLLFEDGTLQHGGHLYHGTITHALLGWSGDHPGPYRMLAVERECAGVTAAAAMLRREVFDRVGGMNTDLAVNYNDVDLSLRVRDAGLSNVWTPHASWYHFEQQSGAHPIDPAETDTLLAVWGDRALTDPYASPLLVSGRNDWLERPGESGAPPYEVLPDGRVSWG